MLITDPVIHSFEPGLLISKLIPLIYDPQFLLLRLSFVLWILSGRFFQGNSLSNTIVDVRWIVWTKVTITFHLLRHETSEYNKRCK
jgi:hypothetical protein